MEEEISLLEIVDILKKRLAMIIVAALLGMGIAGVVTFFLITPQYSSSAELIVQAKSGDGASNTNLQADVNANVLMINTYKDMITGKMILTKVQEELANKYHYNLSLTELKSMITIQQSQNSQMFEIKATTANPTQAADIANMTAAVFQKSAADVVDVNKVTVTSEAEVSSKPVSPNNKLNLAIGLVVGMMIGIGLAFLFALLDKTVKNDKFITEEVELPILGTITELNKKEIQNGKDVKLSSTTSNEETPDQKESVSRRTRGRV